jgi:hypothetical protein
MRRTRPLRERLLSRLIIDPSGCLLWTGATANGYGYIDVGGKRLGRVHRVMWELLEAPIPAGLVLDHLCRVRHCASIAHLEVVTPRVKTLRGEGPSAKEAAQTHCDRGHEFDLINTYWTPDGKRRCRACVRIRRQAGRAQAS